jgi:negative regulator of sigma E activity
VKGIVLVVFTLAGAAPAFAQPPAPAAPQQPAPAVEQPASPALAEPGKPTAPPRNEARQQQVRMMEGVIVAAVRNGAEGLAHQLQVAEPGSLIVTGTARARGFALDGYGVFFDVDVPQM